MDLITSCPHPDKIVGEMFKCYQISICLVVGA